MPRAAATVDELVGDLFDGLETVRLFAGDGEVFGEHGAGDIDGEQDVEATGAGDFVICGDPWSGEREDEEGESRECGKGADLS